MPPNACSQMKTKPSPRSSVPTLPSIRIPARAFTLVELLVVIAIIAILAALLFPAVSRIRMKALEARALSNIKQVGMGYLLVTQDNNGKLPGWVNKNPNVSGFNADVQWSRQVNSMLSQSPDDGNLLPIFQDPAALARKQVSPAYGLHFAPLAAITKYRVEDDGQTAATGPQNLRAYRYLARYNHPVRQILLADSGVSSSGVGNADLGSVDGGMYSWEAAVSGTPSTKGDAPITPGDGGADNIRWYEGAAKFFFLDGHVERRKQDQVLRNNVNPLYP